MAMAVPGGLKTKCSGDVQVDYVQLVEGWRASQLCSLLITDNVLRQQHLRLLSSPAKGYRPSSVYGNLLSCFGSRRLILLAAVILLSFYPKPL
jgi:hypothetical protein